MEKRVITARKKDRLLNILCGEGFSYNYASKLLRNKDVKVDGIRVKENVDIMIGSEITVFYSENSISSKFEIIYQDENIYVISKKSGIEVEGKDGLEGMLKDAMAVHRLDRNTEGLLIMARNKEAKEVLLTAFKNRTIDKKYLAEVIGATNFKGESYKAFLIKDSENSTVKLFSKPSYSAVEIVTKFKTIKSNPASSIVECDLVTGKTHQIRAHLAYLGHPIIGDGKYGKNENNKKFKEKSQKLHCFYLKLNKLSLSLEYLNNKIFINYPQWYKK